MFASQSFNKQGKTLIAWQNISVVDTVANRLIGAPLKVWDDFLSSDPDVPDDERTYTSKHPHNAFPVSNMKSTGSKERPRAIIQETSASLYPTASLQTAAKVGTASFNGTGTPLEMSRRTLAASTLLSEA